MVATLPELVVVTDRDEVRAGFEVTVGIAVASLPERLFWIGMRSERGLRLS